MAAERGTEAPQTRRKTLDEIRREIDDEFAPVFVEPPVEAAPPAARAAAPRRRPSLDRDDFPPVPIRPKRRDRRVTEYLVAGAIGCIVGQGLLIAYVAVLRPTSDLIGALATVERSVLPRRLDGDRTSTGASTATPPGIDPDAAHDQAAATPTTAAPAIGRDDSALAPSAGAPSASPARVSDPEKAPPQLPPRRLSPPPPAAAPAPPSAAPARAKVAGPDDWATSQAQLRVALGEWLRTSKTGGVPIYDPSPEVILGSDGRTAKTRVHDTSGTRYRVYELRWARGPNGWAIVGDGTPSSPSQ